MPANGAISAELSGRRRGCRAVESRVSCRCPALARAFQGRPRRWAQHAVGAGQFVAKRFSPLPVVVPSGAAVPECGAGCIGAQLAARSGDGGAVRAGGVVGPGGACAPATPEAAVNTHERSSARFIPMWENGLRSRRFRN
jgi:hypothetical protein